MGTISADGKILYIEVESSWVPVGCLISNSLSESAEVISTTTRASGGWRSVVPTNQRYSIEAEAYTSRDSGIISYEDLRALKRDRTLVRWKTDDGLDKEIGNGYITEVSEIAEAGEFLTFSLTIEGSGTTTIELSANPDPVASPPLSPLLDFISISSTKICLQWTTPESELPITGYRIYRDDVLWKELGITNSYCDTGVVFGNLYAYNVRAISAAGEGDPSNRIGSPEPVPDGGFNYILFEDEQELLYEDNTISIH